MQRAAATGEPCLAPPHVVLCVSSPAGNTLIVALDCARWLDDADQRLLGVFSAQVQMMAANLDLLSQLHRAAFEDRLLGLPNRLALLRHIDAELAAGRGTTSTLALVDIDQFAAINDAFGDGHGDALLSAMAGRLSAGLPPATTLARVGGDTFGVWGDESAVTAPRLRRLLTTPFDVEGIARPVSVCLGLAAVSGADGDAQSLFNNASIALKQAKSSGIGATQLYSAAVGQSARERARLLDDLQQAFERQDLFVVYQPQFRLADRALVGIEALLRWRHPEGHLVSPETFIPLAERAGLIVPLGEWVIRAALQGLARLPETLRPHRVGINVSPLQMAQPAFESMLDDALKEARLSPEQLEIEITESVALMGVDRAATLLGRLRACGVSIAIDDFGTGYSSLSYLDRLPADRLKLDRSFVQAVDDGDARARIAEVVVPLGRRMGLRVMAEGVETPGQAAALARLGCDEVQGYLYARPMDWDALRAWLTERQRT